MPPNINTPHMPYTSELISLLSRKNYNPLTIEELAGKLNVSKKELPQFDNTIQDLLKHGTLVRLKKDRIVLPRDADLVTGTIRFRQTGSATLMPDPDHNGKTREPLHISAEDTWVARHNDKVLARLNTRNRRFRKGRNGLPVKDEKDTARVIRILQRAQDTLTGTLQKSRIHFYVIPGDPRIINDILVPDPKDSGLDPLPRVNDKVIVKLAPWEQRHLYPEGEIIEVLCNTHSPGAEFKALLHQYGLNPEFPDGVIREVRNLPNKVTPRARKGRLDLRKLSIFTIDPDDAKDFDDALSIEPAEDGGWKVGVHIADVSTYVQPGTSLDQEARQRGNSTYLVGKVIPMLPEELSNGLCSLVEKEDRLTKSVFIHYSKNGRIIDSKTTFANSVIKSRKRLTYKQAYALLFEDNLQKVRDLPLPPKHQTGSTGRPLDELSKKELTTLQNEIRQLWHIASKLREKRMASGSLDLDMPETKIFVDEQGYADRLEKIENDESHQLIEEFMLAANEAVARTLRKVNMPLIHRVHDAPDPDKLDELREYLGTFNIKAGDLNNRNEATKALRKIKEHPQAHILRIQYLRSLKQANYRATADGHYGLNKQDYTHFTSPIRRYSDLIVHRVFDAYLRKHGDDTAPDNVTTYKASTLAGMAEHISITEQNSTEAERESVKLKLLEFFERELSKEQKQRFEAVITDLRNHGMFVELTESGAFGLIHISTLKDLYNLSADGTKLIGRRGRKFFYMGQKVDVEVHRVDRFKRQVDFRLTEG